MAAILPSIVGPDSRVARFGTLSRVTSPTGVFDAHHPPSSDLLADCVHCGFCLPACPTYALWGRETDSPRGRLYLMRVGAGGSGPAGRRLHAPHRHLSRLHGLRHGVPVGRPVRAAHRGHARPEGAPERTDRGRSVVPPDDLRAVPVSGAAAGRSAGPLALSAPGTAVARPHQWRAGSAPPAAAGHGVGGADGRPVLGGRGALRDDPGPGGAPAPGRAAARVRAADLLPRGERGHRARAGRRGVRGRDSPGTGVLRRPDGPRRVGNRCRREGQAPGGRLRRRRRRHHRHQRRWLRIDPQDLRAPAAGRARIRGSSG